MDTDCEFAGKPPRVGVPECQSSSKSPHNTSLLGLVRLGSWLGVWRGFMGLRLKVDPGFSKHHLEDVPVLLCPNHSNWWDGFVACLCHHRIAPDHRFGLLQEEEHLDNYAWFRRAGVLGIDLRTSRASVAGTRTALRYLSGAGLSERHQSSSLWVFPQGVLLDAAAPIESRAGASFLARKSGARVVPIGFRYVWMREAKPTILVLVGAPIDSDEATPERLDQELSSLLERIDARAKSEDLDGFVTVVRGGFSLQHFWDWLRGLLRSRSQ